MPSATGSPDGPNPALAYGAAKQVLEAAIEEAKQRIANHLPSGGEQGALVFHSFMDMALATREKDLLKFDYSLIAIYEHVQRGHAHAGKYDSSLVNELTEAVRWARRLARAIATRYDLDAGIVTIHAGTTEQHTRIGPGHYARLVPQQEWTQLSWLPVGIVNPDDSRTQPIVDGIKQKKWSASILSNALAIQADGLALMSSALMQMLKIQSPTMGKFLRGLNPNAANQCVSFISALMDHSKRKGRAFGAVGACYITPLELMKICAAAGSKPTEVPLIGTALSDKRFPLVEPFEGGYGFSPELAEQLRFLIHRMTVVDGVPGNLRTARAWQKVIRKAMEEFPAVANHEGAPLEELALGKGMQKDVDLLVIIGATMWIVECKAEASPPGAWSADNRASRREKLHAYQEKVRSKIQSWRKHLGTSREVYRDGETIDIARILTRVTNIRGVVVSMRLEPCVERDDIPVITYAPPLPAQVWKAAVDASVCPIWDSTKADWERATQDATATAL